MSGALYTPTPAGSMPATLINAGTTELPVLNPAIINPLTAPTSPGLATTPLMLLIPSGPAIEQEVWDAIFAGVLTTTATSTATIKAYFVPNATIVAGTTATLANSTAIGTSGAVNQNTARTPFTVRLSNCMFDSTSGKLVGTIQFNVNGVQGTAAEFSTIVTSVSNANDPIFGLMLTLTPSAGTQTLTLTDVRVNQ